MEIVLPPLTMINIKGLHDMAEVRRGCKRLVKGSVTIHPAVGLSLVAVDEDPLVPKLDRPLSDRAREELQFQRWCQQNKPEWICPLCQLVFQDPVQAGDGRKYERRELAQWAKDFDKARSPLGGNLGSEWHSLPQLRAEIKAEFESHRYKRQLHEPSYSHPALGKAASLRDISKLGRAFEHLEGVEHMSDNDIHWSRPMFVALGADNTGKSTLLERVTGLPLFPQDESVCTRLPIFVEVRRLTAEELHDARAAGGAAAQTWVEVETRSKDGFDKFPRKEKN
eukprot:4719316-Prymnesium_polylepis.1